MEIKGPSACFFGIRNGLSVFDFGKQGTGKGTPDVWMMSSKRTGSGRLDETTWNAGTNSRTGLWVKDHLNIHFCQIGTKMVKKFKKKVLGKGE
ncbi:unnamed protein product [Rhizophagus irregularis]|nr:unnamed protein product [Rhizophagus irregularis]